METRPGRFKRGNTSPERPGLVFFAYIKDWEYWVTPEKLRQLNSRQKSAMRKWLAKPGSKQTMKLVYSNWVNSPKGRQTRRRVTGRYRKTTDGTIINRVRSRITVALRRGKTKSASTLSLLGCTIAEFKAHLESQFEVGMSWDNMGSWEIDHRVPLAAFNLADPHQQRLAFNFENCRPLWRPVNRKKSDNIEGELFSVRQMKRSNIIQFREVA